MSDDRMPPQSNDSERALLGSLLLSADMGEILALVAPEDFYAPKHQFVFDAMRSLWGRGHPIDVVTVSEELARADALHDVGGSDYLTDLMMETPAVSRAGYYARSVVRASRLRRLVMMASEIIDESYQTNADPDAVFDLLCSASGDRRLMPREVQLPTDYYRAADLRALPPEEFEGGDWIVPGMLRKMWRVLCVGQEGGGKSTMFRQFATLCANGYHPFIGSGWTITPRRSLIIDAENPLDITQAQFDLIDQRAHGEVLSRSENLWTWRLEGGIDLRQRTAQMQLETVLQDCRPELVTMGPVYKLYANGSTDMEQAAVEFLTMLDGFRKRFGFSLLIEHHAPKGSEGQRAIVPYGSSAWLRWPEFGIRMKGEDRDAQGRPHRIIFGRFRGDRGEAASPGWPTELLRDTSLPLPWAGKWPDGTFRDPKTPAKPADEPF